MNYPQPFVIYIYPLVAHPSNSEINYHHTHRHTEKHQTNNIINMNTKETQKKDKINQGNITHILLVQQPKNNAMTLKAHNNIICQNIKCKFPAYDCLVPLNIHIEYMKKNE